MKKILVIALICLSSTVSFGGYYLKGQKPATTSEKPKVVGGGFSFKGENAEPVKNETSRPKYKDGFIHPMDFDNSEEMKDKVISFIKFKVKKNLEFIDSYNNMNARMMEKEELNAFKELTREKDRETMDRVINDLLFIDSLDYINLKMMYNEEKQAGNEELTW